MRAPLALIRCLITFIASGLATAAAAPTPLSYTMSPRFENGQVSAVAIELQFRSGAETETTLELPNEWGGKDKLYEALEGLEVRGAGASISPGAKPESRLIRHSPNATIRVSYRVKNADEGPNRSGNPYRPLISPQRIELLGETVFAAPAGTKMDQPVEVRFKDFPKGWTFASDLEHGHLRFQDLLSSVTVAGDFRIVTRQVHGAPLRLAIQGQWPFTDAWFADRIAAISNAQYDFWRDRAQPYLVTFTQFDGATSSGGTELGDSFALFATPDTSPLVLLRALAHEMTHSWIPRRIGTMPDDQPSEALEYWLSEGFTDYYAQRILVRAGVWSPGDFAKDFNVALGRYAGSPVRTAPNDRISAGFWTNSDLQQLPYDRGNVFATYLDRTLRRASNGTRSLDDVMLAMHAAFQRTPGPIRAAFVAATAAQGMDVGRELAEIIDAGNAIALEADSFVPCGQVVTEDRPNFYRGFDIDATMKNDMRLTGVDPELPAYRAGLRDGMTVVKREAGVIGDSSQELAYRVRDHDTERVIRYLPQGHGRTPTQSVVLQTDPTAAQLRDCARRLGAAN